MALRVGTIFAELRLDKRNFDSGVDTSRRALEGVDGTARRTEGTLRGLGRAFGDVARVAAGFIVAQVGMRAVGAAAGFIRDSFIGMNDLLEQTTIAFTTMLGSGEAADAFLQDLAAFAARTPFDFPGLLTAAQRMMAYGFSAQEVLPLLEDVGNASAALGAGAEGVNRMTLALGQMAAKGRVQTQELLQLTELGIPAFQLLADAVGVSVAEVQEMVSAGQISSDVFLGIFHEWSQANFGDMMEKQSQTFTGAMSNITDVLQMGIARGFEPLFAAMRDGAVRLAAFLETERFESWVTTLNRVMRDAVAAIMSLPATARAFREWVRAIFEDGDYLNDFLTELPGWFAGTVRQIDGLLRAGGQNAILAYAQGIVDGANTHVRRAVEYVADLIAAYLVGQSPPKEGPLAQIAVGGQRTMEAWVGGAAEGARGIIAVSTAIADEMARVDEGMTLAEGRAGLVAAGGSLEDMQALAKNVATEVDEISRAMEVNAIQTDRVSDELEDVNRQIQAVNDEYDALIDPLEEQLDLLRNARDLDAERAQLATDLAQLENDQARLAALGDPEKRAELEAELALVDIEQERLDLAARRAEIEAKLSGDGQELTDKERKRLELELDRLDLARREAQQKLRSGKDLTSLERERLRLRLEEIAQKEAELQARLSGEGQELTDQERARLELQLREIEARQELLDMVDEQAIAEAEKNDVLLDSEEAALDAAEERARLENELLALPIEEKIAKIEAAREKELEPLEAQVSVLETQLGLLADQRAELEDQRREWQLLEGDIRRALAPLEEAKRAADAATSGAGGAADGGAGAEDLGELVLPDMPSWADLFAPGGELAIPPIEVPIVPVVDDNLNLGMTRTETASLGERFGEQFADGILKGIGEILKANAGRFIGGSIGAAVGGAVLGPVGAAIGGVLGGFIGSGLQEELEARGVDFSVLSAHVDRFIEQDVMPVLERFSGWLSTTVMPAVMELSDWFRGDGQRSAGEFATKVGTFFQESVIPVLERVANDLIPILIDAFERIAPRVEPAMRNVYEIVSGIVRAIAQLFDEHRAEVEFVWRLIVTIIEGLMGMMSGTIAFWLAIIAGDWDGAWQEILGLQDTFNRMSEELLRLWLEFMQGAIENFIPWLIEKEKEMGAALWRWIRDATPRAIEFAEAYAAELVDWMETDALPAMKAQVAAWALAFVEWVSAAIQALPAQLGAFLLTLTGWITETAVPAVVDAAEDIGGAIVTGIWNGIDAGTDWLVGKLTDWVEDSIPGPIKKALELFSPSRVMMRIGEDIPSGLAVGIEGNAGVVRDAMNRLSRVAITGVNVPGPNVPAPAGVGGSDISRELALMASAIGGLQRGGGTMVLQMESPFRPGEYRSFIVDTVNGYVKERY